ncbi:trp operon leader peptide [Escherichia coli]|nr:trp operon leader peptide [Shigella sonnei]EGV5454284.1 trp operon leader peptide [Shigella flexneri]EIH4013699.1 trp operon leader peptide [Escherichia coli]EKH8888780.1 trp operon leader peptide [Shigella flexneri]MCI3429492.1 trp operon leader peptide [Escherichia coli]
MKAIFVLKGWWRIS